MQSFTEEPGPKAKKRKLDHVQDGNGEPNAEPASLDATSLLDSQQDLDFVNEPEEDPSASVNGEIEGLERESDDEDDIAEPFDAHFANPNEPITTNWVKSVQQDGWKYKHFATDGWRTALSLPNCEDIHAELPAPMSNFSSAKLKQRLREIVTRRVSALDPVQQLLAPLIFDYRDVFFCSRSLKNAEGLRRLACLHALNHIFK